MDDREAAIERQVRDFLKSIAPKVADTLEALDPAARLWELVDSLSLLDLLAHLEERFHIIIEPVDVIPDNFRNIERIVRFVARSVEARSSSAGG